MKHMQKLLKYLKKKLDEKGKGKHSTEYNKQLMRNLLRAINVT